jgi:hypothetical protein
MMLLSVLRLLTSNFDNRNEPESKNKNLTSEQAVFVAFENMTRLPRAPDRFFCGEYLEKLVQGRERTYFEYFWNVFAAEKARSVPEADRKAYTEAYAKPVESARRGPISRPGRN